MARKPLYLNGDTNGKCWIAALFHKEGHGMEFPCPRIALKMVLGY
jgi:hypothetical protein